MQACAEALARDLRTVLSLCCQRSGAHVARGHHLSTLIERCARFTLAVTATWHGAKSQDDQAPGWPSCLDRPGRIRKVDTRAHEPMTKARRNPRRRQDREQAPGNEQPPGRLRPPIMKVSSTRHPRTKRYGPGPSF